MHVHHTTGMAAGRGCGDSFNTPVIGSGGGGGNGGAAFRRGGGADVARLFGMAFSAGLNLDVAEASAWLGLAAAVGVSLAFS